mgnify:CR=1 FL=1
MERLLTRTEFREGVLERDGHRCVICGASGVKLDAHHIVERRLWTAEHEFGGYFLDNGASVCETHHIMAEQTVLSCDDVRRAAGITKVILPEQYYDDVVIDKWGNYIQPNGTRLRGELFYDESVQKILKEGGVLSDFVDYVKYPRTYHLDFSNPPKDDKVLKNYDFIRDKEVVVTEKMDGENTTMYRDYIHARSLEYLTGEDRGWVKALHARICYDIPEGWRICGENLYAKHSITYVDLESYFNVFSIWNEKNECLSWDDTVEWCNLLGLNHVPVLARGLFDREELLRITQMLDLAVQEGFVVRPTQQFSYSDFKYAVMKFVRPNHVTTSNHWRHQRIVPNGLKRTDALENIVV